MVVIKKKSVVAKVFFSILLVFICLPIFADSSYSVKKGDTLYSISKRYEITVAELRTANNLSENDVLKIGQKLVIPSADIANAATLTATKTETAQPTKNVINETESYTVSKGDTLYSISKRYDIKLYDLLSLNDLPSDAVIKIGQKIKVPVKTSVVIPTQPQVVTSKTEEIKIGDSSLMWPVENPNVVYTKGKVSGVELSAEKDEPVKSIRAGTVMYTGVYRGYGNIVFVESKTGLIYAYSWLGSVNVKKGDYVVCGDTVGTAGKDSTGKPHLTFMVFQNGMPIDPAKAPRG